jgi:AraC-like DNA-binding protein
MQREQTHFWRDDSLGEVEALHARYITHAFAPHTHEGYAIGVIVEGAETFRYRGQTEVAPAGSLVVINPGEVHTGQAATASGWRYRMLYPAGSILQTIASDLAGRQVDLPFFKQPVLQDPWLARELARVHAALEGSESPLELGTRLWTLLARLIERHAEPLSGWARLRPTHCAVRNAQALLEAHPERAISLHELSTRVGLSPYHLLRTFRAEVGLPPHAYQTQLRVWRARRLLQAGLSIAEAAVASGFVDQSHLHRHFRRVVGVSPGTYLRGARVC